MRSVLLVLAGIVLGCLAGEGLVRLGTANQKNYVIEMWRYANLLKQRSDDPAIGHEHRPGRSARLQGVDVSINSLGMRGPEPDPDRPAVVIVGDSYAMGWGVEEADTLRGQLAAKLDAAAPDARWQVLTTGVGNMTLSQSIALWLRMEDRLSAYPAGAIPVKTVILLPTVRSAEPQMPDNAGWLVRNSELAALAVTFIRQAGSGKSGRDDLVAAYRDTWSGGPGRAAMDRALDRLAADAAARGQRVILAQLPDTNDFVDYDFGFMTTIMADAARAHDWTFVDLLTPFRGETAADFWVAPGDVHLNGGAYDRIADQLVPYLVAPAAGAAR